MVSVYEAVGFLVKDIRKSKNYGQKDVSADIMHQTNYSKFELGKIEISFNKLKALLENLEMDMNEFVYLLKDQGSERAKIIKAFKSLTFIDTPILNQIILDADRYLTQHTDRYIHDIKLVSEAMLAVDAHDFETAKVYANQVWERLERLDVWYLSDLKLINNILFLFPIETARTISVFAIKQGEKYIGHEEYDKVLLPFKYNLVHLYLKANEFEEAKTLNDDVLNTFKHKKLYLQIAMCLLRKCLILVKEGDASGANLVEKAYDIAEVMEDEPMKEKVAAEEAYLKTLLSLA